MALKKQPPPAPPPPQLAFQGEEWRSNPARMGVGGVGTAGPDAALHLSQPDHLPSGKLLQPPGHPHSASGKGQEAK